MAMNAISKVVDNIVGHRDVADAQPRPLRSETEMMRAVTWQGKRSMKVTDIGKPLITHQGDAIVKVTACAICSGSDGEMYAGEVPTMDAGFVMGHECMGIIESVGGSVSKFKVGQRVVVSACIACGSCNHCKKQQFAGCEETNNSKLAEKVYGHASTGVFGFSRLLGNYDGSQAQWVRVPFADVNCYPIPDDVSDEKALFLSDVLCTSLHACELGSVQEGDTVCIWGLGPIGLCTARWCQIRKCKRIIAIDLVPERLALAREKLGIEVVDRSKMNSTQLTAKILEMVPEGLDVAIEAVGFRFPMSVPHKVAHAVGLETDTPEMIDECLTCITPYGRVAIIGMYSGYCHAFPIGKIMFKHATVKGGMVPCHKYFEYVMGLVQNGTFDPTFMVTHRFDSLEELPAAYAKLDKKQDGYIKVIATPHGPQSHASG
jgi:threonine dehydrogenase-like Zn-dependent dehydrogenase